jgi:hypothetical protein
MIFSSYTLTANGNIAGPIEIETPLAMSINGTVTFVAERSLDGGTSWVASSETITTNTVRNLSGPGLFRIRATGAGSTVVQFLKP